METKKKKRDKGPLFRITLNWHGYILHAHRHASSAEQAWCYARRSFALKLQVSEQRLEAYRQGGDHVAIQQKPDAT
jgi:hypothetical protein